MEKRPIFMRRILLRLQHFSATQKWGKVALCQRDIAIQSSLLIFTLISALARQKIKPIPIFIWFIFGLLPIALDGGTQLLSQLGLQWLL